MGWQGAFCPQRALVVVRGRASAESGGKNGSKRTGTLLERLGVVGTLRWADVSDDVLAATTGDETAIAGGVGDSLTTGPAWPAESAIGAGIGGAFVIPR